MNCTDYKLIDTGSYNLSVPDWVEDSLSIRSFVDGRAVQPHLILALNVNEWCRHIHLSPFRTEAKHEVQHSLGLTGSDPSSLNFFLLEKTTSKHNSTRSKHSCYYTLRTNLLRGKLQLDAQTSDVTSYLRLSQYKILRHIQKKECYFSL